MYSKNPSDSAPSGHNRNAYGLFLATLVAGSALVLLFAVFPPQSVRAFWLFATTKAADNGELPILHDASLPLLQAAINSDPNPIKGGVDIAVSGGSALVANSGPDGTVTASALSPVASNDQISLYVVREGDSLSDIGSMFGVSVNTILWANDLKSAKDIHAGETLLILPVSGVQHTVAKGETLAGIAKKYDADADEIAVFNGLDGEVALTAGNEIIIPGGGLAPKATVKSGGAKSGTLSKALPVLSGYFGNPVPGARLSQGIHGNNGVDLSAPNGTAVYASAGGQVLVVKNNGGYNGGYGNYIVIKHDNGTQTLYAHLSSVGTSIGAVVEKGERIGGVGNTGRSTGNHLHFEVRGARNPFAK